MGMNTTSQCLPQMKTAASMTSSSSLLVQRQCACGGKSSLSGECEECKKKNVLGVQPKLEIGSPEDIYEREADHVADQILREPSGKNPNLTPLKVSSYTGFSSNSLTPAPPSVINVVAKSGQPIEPTFLNDMEHRFGRDFSRVSVHTDTLAQSSATEIGAKAYTVGRNIVFGRGYYQPHSDDGKKLLAHELTHVVQQSGDELGVGQTKMVLQREGEDDVEPQLTRSEEIALSHSSVGEYTGTSDPLTLSLFNFGIDISSPKTEHTDILRELGRLLTAVATISATVRVIGFADATGPERHNRRLSLRRAKAVKDFLQPLIGQRISLSAYGETNPIADNESLTGRNRNRRVDIRFAISRPPIPPPDVPERPTEPTVEPPVPPGVDPPPVVPPANDERNFCEEYPLICGIGLTPFTLPLICFIAPEVCIGLTCALVPELCLIPVVPDLPDRPDPPKKPDDEKDPRVFFRPDTRADNTPAGMTDRVGLVEPMSITAIVLNQPPITNPITIEVDGVSSQAGDADINGSSQIQITGTTTFDLKGKALSAPNHAPSPFLQLAAWWSNDLVGSGNRFAVTAIAQDWSVDFDGTDVTQYGYAFYTKMDWQSDGNSYSELSNCRYVELVELIEESGGMSGMGIGGVNDPDVVETADLHPTFDQHGTEHGQLGNSAGHNKVKQLFRIGDERSSPNWGWVASRNSGFEIDRRYRRDPANPRCWQLRVEKKGAAVDAGGLHADAGSGQEDHTFRNINCDPPPPTIEDPPVIEEPPIPDEPTPEPVPEETPTQEPECDYPEMARRVDLCIEQARQDAIECTLDAAWPPPVGPVGIKNSIEFLICLDNLKERLARCDQAAKRDTNCEEYIESEEFLAANVESILRSVEESRDA